MRGTVTQQVKSFGFWGDGHAHGRHSFRHGFRQCQPGAVGFAGTKPTVPVWAGFGLRGSTPLRFPVTGSALIAVNVRKTAAATGGLVRRVHAGSSGVVFGPSNAAIFQPEIPRTFPYREFGGVSSVSLLWWRPMGTYSSPSMLLPKRLPVVYIPVKTPEKGKATASG